MVADLSLSRFDEVKEQIKKALTNDNPWKRYWGLVVCTSFGEKAKSFAPQIKKMLEKDGENLVRTRALEYLLLNHKSVDLRIVDTLLKNAKSETEASLILNSLALVKSSRPGLKFNLSKEIFPPKWYDKPNDLVNMVRPLHILLTISYHEKDYAKLEKALDNNKLYCLMIDLGFVFKEEQHLFEKMIKGL